MTEEKNFPTNGTRGIDAYNYFFAIFSSVTRCAFSSFGFDRPEPRDMLDNANELDAGFVCLHCDFILQPKHALA